MKIRVAYLSPSHPLIAADLNTCFGGEIDGLDGREPQRQTRGLELPSDHRTGESPT